MNRDEDYKADLLTDLRSDAEYAARYLSAAISDSKEAFLVALRDVVEAQKGISMIAAESGLNRESLYKTLSKGGNPRLDTLSFILSALGYKIEVKIAQEAKAAPGVGLQEYVAGTYAQSTTIEPRLLETAVTCTDPNIRFDAATSPPVWYVRSLLPGFLWKQQSSAGPSIQIGENQQ